jgi:hypothetical protein
LTDLNGGGSTGLSRHGDLLVPGADGDRERMGVAIGLLASVGFDQLKVHYYREIDPPENPGFTLG